MANDSVFVTEQLWLRIKWSVVPLLKWLSIWTSGICGCLFYWFSKSFEDGKILPKKWKSDCFQIFFLENKTLPAFPFCSNLSLSLFNFHESFSITGDTIRNGLDYSGFFADERPSVPPQDQRERPLERLARVCGRALLCPERTCAAVKSHTEKGEDGEKYFGKTEARCLSAFFYTFPKWSSPDKMGCIRALHSLFIALYLMKLHLD